MSIKNLLIALSATAVFGAIGASQAFAATPQCGVFEDNSGTISVTTQGTEFSLSQLMNDGSLSGRGPQFGCWEEIGTADELRNTTMYRYSVTDPSGESWEFGSYGIQAGGFGSGAIAIPKTGTYRVEYFLVSRDDGSKSSIGATTFTINP